MAVIVSTGVARSGEVLQEPASKNKSIWAGKAAESVLKGAVGSVDVWYARDIEPKLSPNVNAWSATGWRGERINAQFVIWTGTGLKNAQISLTDLKSESGKTISATNLVPSWVRYTIGGSDLFADILEPNKPIDIPGSSVRPVWLNVNIPQDATPGVYSGILKVVADGGREKTFSLKVEVLAASLPPVRDWSLNVDIFQGPWALAQYYKLEPWSDAHWAKVQELLDFSADMGVKYISTYLLSARWVMIKAAKKKDGTWDYDYSLFDKYVDMAIKSGTARFIKLGLPWNENVVYRDEAQGSDVIIKNNYSDKGYREYWTSYLQALAKHLKEKGWFDRSLLYVDEPKGRIGYWLDMRDEVVPELKVQVAACLKDVIPRVHDVSILLDRHERDPERNLARKKEGKETSFYICSFPKAPNTLVWNMPGEATWMGWYAASQNYTGFLRWAMNLWVNPWESFDPFMDIKTGDLFLAYPGLRSSIRLERLREGFQDYEKIRIVKEKLSAMGNEGQNGLKELDNVLAACIFGDIQVKKGYYAKNVNDGKAVLEKLTREVFSK
jgi:hypothetical protein